MSRRAWAVLRWSPGPKATRVAPSSPSAAGEGPSPAFAPASTGPWMPARSSGRTSGGAPIGYAVGARGDLQRGPLDGPFGIGHPAAERVDARVDEEPGGRPRCSLRNVSALLTACNPPAESGG